LTFFAICIGFVIIGWMAFLAGKSLIAITLFNTLLIECIIYQIIAYRFRKFIKSLEKRK
jgi:hypothetical protein